jgi:hypothetical protein
MTSHPGKRSGGSALAVAMWTRGGGLEAVSDQGMICATERSEHRGSLTEFPRSRGHLSVASAIARVSSRRQLMKAIV